MDATADELAGVVDLFGGLTRSELERALAEAAFRADGASVDEDALEAAVDRALESFALVAYEPSGRDGGTGAASPATDGGDETLLVAGPTAFPTVPDHAEDVPHILDVEPRRFDRETLGEAVRDEFVDAVEDAADDGDTERIETLLDVSYDLEAWAPVELDDERTRLDAALE
ncbi:hypothetical protein CV102_01530 [Natronococcus pandeyae]|uniref:Uncharacterized protein n=1 Tax=Natronococcus pandeyae TaxID=2055836 RepID=A0A8J8Q7U4_9EURY|nr:hypothetical protein [Natronococcus pandeyae]TYL40288.1 hypothetical protein CV102_01530 [Natronococcus pandeyae]